MLRFSSAPQGLRVRTELVKVESHLEGGTVGKGLKRSAESRILPRVEGGPWNKKNIIDLTTRARRGGVAWIRRAKERPGRRAEKRGTNEKRELKTRQEKTRLGVEARRDALRGLHSSKKGGKKPNTRTKQAQGERGEEGG